MNIKNISILGLGLIGGSIAKALNKTQYNFHISAYDKQSVLTSAINEKTIHSQLTDIEDSLNSDLIFLCLPVDSSLEVFEKIAPKLKPSCILTDVCGIKSIFQKKWNSYSSAGIYVGGHPMTGKEKSGYEFSDPLLFENAVYILSDNAKENEQVKDLLKIIQALGARITYLDPFVHDKIVAHVSHLPQLLSVALVNMVSQNKGDLNYLDFAAGGFRDMTRIASSNFDIWEPVIKSNRQEIQITINSAIEEFEKLRDLLDESNLKTIAQKFEEARIKRDEIPTNTKGFLNPLHDIFIFVRDEPGVISKISTALFNKNINIKDIELLKIREGTGGTFRLSFETNSDAASAKSILEDLGFQTK